MKNIYIQYITHYVIYNTFIYSAKDLDIVMLMYNLLEYSDNYSMTSGYLCNYYSDEVNGSADENENNFRINNNKTTWSKYFERKTKIIWTTLNNNNMLDLEVAPLKYF